MSDPAANLEVLIQIREELAGLRRTQQGLKETKKEAESLGTVIRQGLGIGGGMAIATGAVALLKNTLFDTARASFAFAGQMKDTSEALGLNTSRLQVLRLEAEKAGVDIGRLSMAIGTQNQSLAEARDQGSAAAAAYRTLGLEAAKLEAMPVDERLIAVARAMDASRDKTAAFHAAAQILGARGLPQLLNALRDLGTQGVDAIEKLYQKQGLIMGDDTIARLDAAEKQWAKFYRGLVIGSGEALATMDRLAESANKAPGQTWLAIAKSLILGPSGLGDLAAVIGQHTASPTASPPPNPSAPMALPLAQTQGWRAQELALLRAQNAEATIQAQHFTQEEAQRRQLARAIGQQIDAQRELLRLLEQTELAPSENQHDRDKAIIQAKGQLALLEQRKLAAQFGGLKPRSLQSIEDYQQVNNTNRPGYMTAGEGMMTGLREWVTGLGSTGEQVASILNNSLGATLSSLSADVWDIFRGTQSWSNAFKNLGNIAGRMLTQMIIQMTLVKSLQVALGWLGIVSGAASGVGGSVDAGGGGAFPTLNGLSDTSAFIGGAGAGAGGGTFVTSGPAQLTVGDNPGGVELVNVIPISGKGRSWARGNLAHFAGGGSLLAGGGLRGLGGGALAAPVHVAFNFATGVAATVRAEVMAMAPELRMLAVEAVQTAHNRNALKLG